MPIALQVLLGLRPDEHEQFQRALLDAGLIHGLGPGKPRRFWRATPRELAACELLSMFPWIHSSGLAKPRAEREYDRSAACAACGIGLRPLGPLRLRKGEIPKAGMRTPLTRSTLAGRRLIACRRVYQLCRRLKLRGIRFTPVVLT